MALQWKGKSNFSFVNINTLIEKIPMVNVEDKYKKRDIKKALKILNDKEMVKIKYDDNNKDKVYFIFDQLEDEDISIYGLDKYNSYSEIKEAYFKYGFRLDEIDEYLNVEDIRYIQALLRYIDTRIKNKSIKYIKRYIKKCIKNPLRKIDKGFYNRNI